MLHAYVSYLSAALPINEKINKSACAAAAVSFVVDHQTRPHALSNYCVSIMYLIEYRTVEFEGNGVT